MIELVELIGNHWETQHSYVSWPMKEVNSTLSNSFTTVKSIKAMLRNHATILLLHCQPEELNSAMTSLCMFDCLCLRLSLSEWIIPLRSQYAAGWSRADGLEAATYPPWQPVINDEWRLALMKPGKGIKKQSSITCQAVTFSSHLPSQSLSIPPHCLSSVLFTLVFTLNNIFMHKECHHFLLLW